MGVPHVKAEVHVVLPDGGQDLHHHVRPAFEHVLEVESDMSGLAVRECLPEVREPRHPPVWRTCPGNVSMVEDNVCSADLPCHGVGQIEPVSSDLAHHRVEATSAEVAERSVLPARVI